jgi:RNA polymerase sigma-70 factor (ECF subfamily)
MQIDVELIERARNGDSAAFNQLVLQYRRRILGTIARLIGRPEDAEDMAQEVFLRLYFSLDQLRAPQVFEAWLYRLTVNAAYDYLRRRRRRGEARMADLSPEQVALADAAAGTRAEQEEQRRRRAREEAEAVLSVLPEADRILLSLKEIEGLSLSELAGIYKVKENALKVRLYRARQRALRALAALEEQQGGKG